MYIIGKTHVITKASYQPFIYANINPVITTANKFINIVIVYPTAPWKEKV